MKHHTFHRLTLQFLSFNDTADHSPVSAVQLRGSGTRLQRGTVYGVDDALVGSVEAGFR